MTNITTVEYPNINFWIIRIILLMVDHLDRLLIYDKSADDRLLIYTEMANY